MTSHNELCTKKQLGWSSAYVGYAPERVNADPYGEGWLVKIHLTEPKETGTLLSAGQYQQTL